MNFVFAIFLPNSQADASSFDCVDKVVSPIAAEKRLMRWHPYEFCHPAKCIGNAPMESGMSMIKSKRSQRIVWLLGGKRLLLQYVMRKRRIMTQIQRQLAAW